MYYARSWIYNVEKIGKFPALENYATALSTIIHSMQKYNV